jgi:anti-anti-sigma factor
MEILQEKKDGKLIIRINGRIDSVSSETLENTIKPVIEAGENKLAIDFSKIEYISSSGLRAILLFAKLAKKGNGSVVLFAMNENIKEIFKISGFISIIQVVETEQEALAAL